MEEGRRIKAGHYIITIIVTIAFVWLYIFLRDIKISSSFISYDIDKATDSLAINIMQNNIADWNLFSFWGYNLQYLLVLILGSICSNMYISVNIYFIFTFLLISVSMLTFLQRFNIRPAIAVGVSVIMSFLPYHIDRGESQLVTSSFFMVPIFAGIFYELYYEAKTESINRWYLIVMGISPLIDLKLSIMVIILMVVLAIHRRSIAVVRISAIYLCPLVLMSLLIGKLTGLFSVYDLNRDIEMARAEGMRFMDLLMPFRYHILDIFHNYRCEYDVMFSAHGESGLNSMGILLSVGFVASILLLFVKKKTDKRIQWMAWLNVLIILIANINGFNILFEYFGIHITYWNRMAIFILVWSGAVLAIIADGLLNKVEDKKYFLPVKAVMFCIGLLEFVELLMRQNMGI